VLWWLEMDQPDTSLVRVTYMELRESPPPPTPRSGPECIAGERLSLQKYVALYRSVGEPLRWDQRLLMPQAQLAALLDSGSVDIYVLRDEDGSALGFCEFERGAFPEIELKNFGLIPEAQGRGLGLWLLSVALCEEWKYRPARIWLHTDTWDHPAAIGVYERAGLRVYAVRDEVPGPL
jgi:ribosomal protein S18 acetylase RimI-like enzyme